MRLLLCLLLTLASSSVHGLRAKEKFHLAISKGVAQGEQVEISVLRKFGKDSKASVNIRLTAFSEQVELNLHRPDSSIFTDGFTLGTSTMSRSKLEDLEGNIWVDSTSQAVVQILESSKGVHRVQGYMSGMSIFASEDGQHFVTRSNPLKSSLARAEWCGVPKYVPQDQGQNSNDAHWKNTSIAADAVVEIHAVLDRTLSIALGDTQDLILIYVAITFHAVNVIFGDLSNPPLQAKLAGVSVLTAAEDLLIVQKTEHNISPMLYALRDWGNGSPAGVGPNDLVALLTGVETLDGAGIAFLNATCESYKYSVNRDMFGFWEGVHVVAHEVGHNLGADHDFETTCPDEGYIMGYAGGTADTSTTKKFHFSECSKAAIRGRLSISAGSCLYRDDAGAGISLGNSDPGDKLSFEAQCEKRITAANYGTSTGVQPQANPADACIKLTCKFRKTDGSNWLVTFVYPAEGSSCNQSGGRCRAGICK